MTLCLLPSDLTAPLAHHKQMQCGLWHLATDIPAWYSIVLSVKLGLGLQSSYLQDARPWPPMLGAVPGCGQAWGICSHSFIHSFPHSLIPTSIHSQTLPNTSDMLWQAGLLGRKDAEPISHPQLRNLGSQREPL